MSIYATGFELRFPVDVPCSREEMEAERWGPGESPSRDPGQPVRTRWIEIFCQLVPAHIGNEGGPDEPDWYSDFLPPRVHYDADEAWTKVLTPRAVFILDEDHDEKIGQRYTNPLLMLTGAEYEAATFDDLCQRIVEALEVRFGDPSPTTTIVRATRTPAAGGGEE